MIMTQNGILLKGLLNLCGGPDCWTAAPVHLSILIVTDKGGGIITPYSSRLVGDGRPKGNFGGFLAKNLGRNLGEIACFGRKILLASDLNRR